MTEDNFLSSDALSLTPKEYSALVEVLHELEDGEIVYDPTCKTERKGFNYASIAVHHDKGTCACIAGWAKIIGGNHTFAAAIEKEAFGPVRSMIIGISPRVDALIDLFFGPLYRKWELASVTPQEAAKAIRNYLTTGNPNWHQIKGD